jgi:hypothetical protein
MLHHRAAVELGELGAQRAGGQRLVAQRVEDRSAVVRSESPEDAILLVDDGV